ncbi:hypothetical protein CER22_25120 [Bacillus sp. K2I17]|nr:hypothetical protein CER22_25120 [Bacillus sp. K2I17]
MNYIDTYQYKEIHANELKIPKYCIRLLFIYLIVRKIGISCEVVGSLFLLLLINFYAPLTKYVIHFTLSSVSVSFSFRYIPLYILIMIIGHIHHIYMMKCKTINFNCLTLNRLYFLQNLIVYDVEIECFL